MEKNQPSGFKEPILPPAASESQPGLFESWFKKDKSETRDQKNTAETPRETTRLEKFARTVARLLRQDGDAKETPRPQAETDEQPEHTESPVVEEARGVRKFARKVLSFVIGVAATEQIAENPTAKEPAAETTHLFEAADDLREALHELDDALPETAESHSESTAAEVNFGEPREWHSPFTAERPVGPSPAERAALLLAETRYKAESMKDRALATTAVALGGFAFGATLLLAYRARKERRRLDKVEDQQEKAAKIAQEQHHELAQQKTAFRELKKEQQTEHDHQKQHNYYERLSEFTHHQADVTREVAHDVREVRQQQEVLLQQPVQFEQQEQIMRRSSAEQTTESPFSWMEPLKKVERSDTVEQGAGLPGRNLDDAGSGTSGGAYGSGVWNTAPLQTQPLGSKNTAAAKDKSSQTNQPPAQHLWAYGVALLVAMAGFVLVLIFM